MRDLSGRRAVVTGGSRGIGAACVSTLAERGVDVAVCARSEADISTVLERAASAPGRVVGFAADLSDAVATAQFLAFVDAELGPADILVNNVGVSPSRNFLFLSDDGWQETFQLNLMSAVRCTRHLLPAMRKQKWGRIVMVATTGARYPNATLVDYGASKAAMLALSKALARKYAADNVLVNSVLPGLIHTSMWDRAAEEIAQAQHRSTDEVFASLAEQVPLGRYGTPEEVAAVVAFLCSDAASYLAGCAIEIDGALSTAV